MSDDVPSTLTVAKLKALCILNDLATSGKKSDLVERLMEAGLARGEVGLPAETESKPEDELQQEEVVLSMEDEDTLTPDVEPVKEVAAPVKTDEDEVLEAEILEAVLVEETVI